MFLNLFSAVVWGNTVASKVFTEFNALIHEWRKRVNGRNNKLTLRQLKAVVPMRFRIADSFIDRYTPLVAQNLVASQTADLILL